MRQRLFLLLAWARQDTASIFSFKYLRLEVRVLARTIERTRKPFAGCVPADLEVNGAHVPRGGMEGKIISSLVTASTLGALTAGV